MSNWRVFVGLWDDPEVVTHLDDLHEDWSAARAQLDARLARWATDSCEDCVRTAAEELEVLRGTGPDQEFVGEVEGEDYLLIKPDRGEIQDLWNARLSRRERRENHQVPLVAVRGMIEVAVAGDEP